MYKLSYYPWLTQNVPSQEIDRQIKIFAAEVSNELKRSGARIVDVEVLPPLEVPDQIEQVATGKTDIALMNPLGFVFANRRSPGAQAIAVAQRIIDGVVGVVYFSQLYARVDRGFASLKDLGGKSVGYGTPVSTSNFLMPAQLLLRAGVHPWLGFRRIAFLQGHELVARAVYKGEVDVGAGHDGVIVDLANQPGFEDAASVLKQIARTPSIPSDPVVTTIAREDERQVLQAALIAAGRSGAGSAALKVFWGNTQGLQATTSAAYDPLLSALKDMKLDQGDILGSAGR